MFVILFRFMYLPQITTLIESVSDGFRTYFCLVTALALTFKTGKIDTTLL